MNEQGLFRSSYESSRAHAPVRVQSVRVKICGITRAEDARLAVELGAAALGFNFYPPSPRYIAPEAASVIVAGLPPLVTTVGVFADETEADHLLATASTAQVDAIQLHGPQFPKSCATLRDYPLILAVALRDTVPIEEAFGMQGVCALKPRAFLLDSFDPGLIGGTGKTINWAQAKEAGQYGAIILAGGLNPANVARAIREARPFAVDVASGVESAPGRKDPEKLRAFFAAVAHAHQDIESSGH